jgi:hypothetical protein
MSRAASAAMEAPRENPRKVMGVVELWEAADRALDTAARADSRTLSYAM